MVRGYVLHRCCNRLGGNALTQTIDINGYWTVYICYNVDLGELNSGFTATDYSKRMSIVSIGLTTSKAELINTIVHEAKHVQSHICKYYHVSEGGESAAYLIGYLTMKMYHKFRNLL
jgi:hypothetical protein